MRGAIPMAAPLELTIGGCDQHQVACDWWDDAEGSVLQEWGIEYEEVEEN